MEAPSSEESMIEKIDLTEYAIKAIYAPEIEVLIVDKNSVESVVKANLLDIVQAMVKGMLRSQPE